MKAAEIKTYHSDLLRALKSLTIVEKSEPVPNQNQVVVKVQAAIVNPSDLSFLRGVYGIKKEVPVVPGFEGAGEVVKAGDSDAARSLIGQRVAFAANDESDGTWAQFALADVGACMPLHPKLPDEQAAGFIVNPFTAYGMMEAAKNKGAKAVIITAAASQLAGMLRAFADELSIRTINIVRDDDQVRHLHAKGEEFVLNTRDDQFYQQLKQLAHKKQATMAFDAVSGGTTGLLISAMPPKSEVLVYGALSENPISSIDPRDLIFHQKSIRGFSLGPWIQSKPADELGPVVEQIQRMILAQKIQFEVQKTVALEQLHAGIHQYIGNMSDGKIIIKPWQE